jgi:hypothetical protein
MKVSRTGLWLIIALIVALLILGGGYYVVNSNNNNDNNSGIRTVDASVNVAVRVLDLVNNTPVTGVPVYIVACCGNGTSDRDVHQTNLTGEDGWALFFANYTLDKDQVIYLGACNRKPLVESDFAGKQFNGTGYLGEWKSFNYSMLYNNQDNTATIGCTITVDLDSGKMI